MTIGYGNALTEKNYRSGITLATQLQSYIWNFVGDGGEDGGDPSTAMIVKIDRPGSKRGDSVKVRFADINYDEKPLQRASQVLGQEGTTPRFETDLVLRYQGFAGRIDNVPADQNNVSFDLKRGEIDRIVRQWAYNFDRGWLYHAVGYTPANDAGTDFSTTSCNAVTALDAAHILYAPDTNGANANPAAVAAESSSVLTTDLVDEAVAQMTTRQTVSGGYGVKWPFAPCKTPFGELFVLLTHPTGFKQIRTNSGDSAFYDLSRAELEGGGVYRNNPLITGQGTIYNNTLILSSNWLPPGITSSAAQDNTRMAAFLGARAFHVLFGEGYAGDSFLGWSEHMVHRTWSCLSDTVWGLKRTDVDGQSWASAAIVHYSHANDTN